MYMRPVCLDESSVSKPKHTAIAVLQICRARAASEDNRLLHNNVKTCLMQTNSHVWLLWQQLIRVQQAAQGSCALQPLPNRAIRLQFHILLSLLKLVVWLLKGIQNCLHNMLPC